jgi:hypothetical protein
MKNSIVCIPLLVACLLGTLSAAIPQLINYQGLLLDDNGTKVTGIKAITLKVFTGATDGNGTKEIYDENVGNVSITDGLYAFNFGGTGLSVITTTETVGSGDGSQQIYNYTVLHPPVLADSASIVKSDVNGTAIATWSQTGGSDDPSFISSVVNSSGAVSVTNASGAPAPGEEVKITYDYNSVGIMGALASNPNAWLEVSVDGSPLLPRQRLVAVPFANVAGTIQGENLSVDPVSGIVKIKEGLQVGNSPPITNATSSLGYPQGHSGEIVNYRYNGTNSAPNWYTVPTGKTLYITNVGTTTYAGNIPGSSPGYRGITSGAVFPSGISLKSGSNGYGFTGFLKNNETWITPIWIPDTTEYTVPNGKKLVVTSSASSSFLIWDTLSSAWNYVGTASSDRPILAKSGDKVKTDSYGWTGYLIDE